MPDGVCVKCGWRAPAGLLKCPFCKTYIREPGSGSSSEEPARRLPETPPPRPPEPDPPLPPPDAGLVRRVQRELARELFDDSSQWPVFEGDLPLGGAAGAVEGASPDEETDVPHAPS